MEKLIAQMKVVQASVFALYLKAHNYHWNVEGPDFGQYHSFLDGLYNEWWSSVDAIAEEIRSTRSYAPGSLSRFKELSVVEDEINIPTPLSMLAKLRDDNMKVIGELVKARAMAEDAKAFGLVNFFEDRIDKHYKNDWMLRAYTRS